jgi:DNA-binding NarL/FixJ family response regulator
VVSATDREPGIRPAGDPGQGDALAQGRARYAARAWDDAYTLLSRADAASPLAAPDLERLAWSAALTGRDASLLAVMERVYEHHLESGDSRQAARAAFWVGFRLFALGESGRAGGWLMRGQRLVEREATGCVEAGYLLLPTVHRQLMARDHEGASATADQAAGIGVRFGDHDLVALARQLQGRALVRQGRLDAGLSLLDEVMVAATGGDLSPLVTGLTYCSVIALCQEIYALERSREWTTALAAWCDAQPQLVTFSGTCLVHRAQVMQLTGDWREAIAQARRAAHRPTSESHVEAAGDAAYQEGEIHRLRGEFAEAEAAYRAASQAGRDPQPGLALLRLGQGRTDAAAQAIRRVLGSTTDRLQRARMLPASVEVLLAADDVAAARAASDELAAIAAAYDTDVLAALAAHARGMVALADGNAQEAVEPLRRAFQVWQKVGAPYLAARLRVLLAHACRAIGDVDGADLEQAAAREVFAALGAQPDLARLDEVHTPGAEDHTLTPREVQVLRLVASGITNRAIAVALGLSEKTVDRHLSNIFVKVGVASRAAATAWAYEHGIIPPAG